MRWNKFLENIQSDLKLFAFILAVLCLYRISFMFIMNGYMEADSGTSDILLANWAGLRLSLKTAGIVMALSVILGTLPQLIFNRLPQRIIGRIRLGIGTLFVFIFSVLFQGRFPYYQEYHMSYGMQILQGLDDDRSAIFVMMIQEYGLIWRSAAAVALTVVLYIALKKILNTKTLEYSVEGCTRLKKALVYVGTLLCCVVYFLFVRFGGAFNYEHSINWENAGITGDAFLNECILDDGQAMYRVRAMHDKMQAGNVSGVEKEHLREYAAILAGHDVNSDNISEYIKRTAEGAKIAKPKHIFIILGETWMQWPLLDKYENLHIADGFKGLIKEDNCYYTPYFMPNGDFTSSAITGMITGLSNFNISVNYQPRSFKEEYPAAIAKPFHDLGYRVDFWYGGIPTWDNINSLAKSQGFDNFYGMPDFNGPKQSIWGTKDEYLFNAIREHLSAEEPTVHIIMTTTNHPPYNLDLAAEGFDLEREKQETAKMENLENSDEMAVEFGHYWYMDKMATRFVREVSDMYPDSLFVITGDHAVRSNPSRNPSMFEMQSVPFVLYGQGVTKDVLPSDVVGGHTSIMPTLVELIAPKGFEYYSIADSMTHSPKAAFNNACWMTNTMMGAVDNNNTEILFDKTGNAEEENSKAMTIVKAMRTVSWWLLMKGNNINQQ